LARFGGDRELFAELVGFLLDDLPPLRNNLRHAVAKKDAASVRGAAHAIKGLVAGCGGVRATHVAQAIEDAGREGDIGQAASHMAALDNELESLSSALQVYRASGG
jgi:HPt (histidine-containing phosphotransfer) domain-containing protein